MKKPLISKRFITFVFSHTKCNKMEDFREELLNNMHELRVEYLFIRMHANILALEKLTLRTEKDRESYRSLSNDFAEQMFCRCSKALQKSMDAGFDPEL
jgi:hypothetical protein